MGKGSCADSSYAKYVSPQDVVSLPSSVDPFQVLQRLGQERGGVHCSDNVVEYYERVEPKTTGGPDE